MFRKLIVSSMLSPGFFGYSGMIEAETTMTALVAGANTGIAVQFFRQLRARGNGSLVHCVRMAGGRNSIFGEAH